MPRQQAMRQPRVTKGLVRNTVTHTLSMTTSKKRKSSTSLRVSRPHALRARTVTFHSSDDRSGPSMTTGKSVVLSASAASPETLGKLLSKRPECDDTFSEYTADQTDIQHNDPANTKGKEKSKQRKRTAGMVMEEWLGYRDSYLQEMLRHDGRKGLQVCAESDCDTSGDYSCYDCAYCMHYCRDCLVNRHRLMPLHRIKVWKLIL